MDEKEIQSYYSGHFTDADTLYMRRALQLAAAGKGHVAPNPMVGAVIVAPDGRLIGEGWHRHYGTPHAEVNAIASVADTDRHLLPQSTIYVTLEPCSHYGKTPPCAKLLIETGFRRVVSATVDPNPLVAGRGLKMLADAGIQTEVGLLGDESRRLNKVFFTAHTHHRPFITLKWAQSADGYLATKIPPQPLSTTQDTTGNGSEASPTEAPHTEAPSPRGSEAPRAEAPQSTHDSILVFERKETGQIIPIGLSSPIGIRYVHMRRATHQAIAIGARTAIIDNPGLTTRHYAGPNPRPIIFDRHRLLPNDHPLLTRSDTIHLTAPETDFVTARATCCAPALSPHSTCGSEAPRAKASTLREQISDLYKSYGITSLLVEGGAALLNEFIREDLWDEAYIERTEKILDTSGAIPAPIIPTLPDQIHPLGTSTLYTYYK